MKKYILLYLFLISLSLQAQNCETPKSKVFLDGNNVKALLTNGGGMWFDSDSTKGTYGFPDIGINQGLSAGVMISALSTQGNNLHFAYTRYQIDDGDFWSGPILSATDRISNAECELWNRHFKINKSEIDIFKQNNFPISLNNIPLAVKEWPAKGNQYMINQGMTLQNDYAPFIDENNNGIYDPKNGDYPSIKGDQAIYWIVNDYEGQFHSDYYGEKIGVEIQIMAYAYATNNILNDATFYDYKLTNKSNKSFKDFYFSQYMNINNGDAFDDKVGVDSINKYVYYYGDNNQCGVIGENCNPIITSSFICAENDINLSSYSIIKNTLDYYTTTPLNIRNRQNGLNNDGTLAGNYTYSGNPSDSSQISECSLNTVSNDYKLMLNSGPHQFYIGEVLEFTLMVSTNFQYYTTCPNRDSLITPKFLEAKNLYFAQEECGFKQSTIGTSINNIEKLNLEIYPNPSNGIFTIKNPNNLDLEYSVLNTLGQKMELNTLNNSIQNIHLKEKGIYFIQFMDKTTSKTYIEKVIVQ